MYTTSFDKATPNHRGRSGFKENIVRNDYGGAPSWLHERRYMLQEIELLVCGFYPEVGANDQEFIVCLLWPAALSCICDAPLYAEWRISKDNIRTKCWRCFQAVSAFYRQFVLAPA